MVIHSDNQAVVHVVNSGYSKDKELMHLIRCMFFFRAYWGFKLIADHVPGEQNVAADVISRNNLSLFSQVLPEASPQLCPIPRSLVELLIVQFPTGPHLAGLHCSRIVCSGPGRVHSEVVQVG